jgi:hypothetical protein
MKPESQIKAIAELDGFKFNHLGRWQAPNLKPYHNINHDYPLSYLTSRDAIIPVIEKCVINTEIEMKFNYALYALLPKREDEIHGMTYVMAVLATPAQLTEALLRATGKWIEE